MGATEKTFVTVNIFGNVFGEQEMKIYTKNKRLNRSEYEPDRQALCGPSFSICMREWIFIFALMMEL